MTTATAIRVAAILQNAWRLPPSHKLTEWERQFLASIRLRATLTEKQLAALTKIEARLALRPETPTAPAAPNLNEDEDDEDRYARHTLRNFVYKTRTPYPSYSTRRR